MKILHLCGGNLSSGATLGATSLHKALLQLGVDSKLIFPKGDISAEVPEAEPFFKSSLSRRLFNISMKWIEPTIIKRETTQKGHGLSLGMVGHPLFIKRKEIEAADIIHLHWINSRFIRTKAIQHFKKPIIWTLRDAWPYTGGCHYTADCERYKIGCGECPLLHSSNPNDISRKVVDVKKQHLPKHIRYIALSNWTAQQASESYLLNDSPIEVIPNCIDDIFLSPSTKTKEEARKRHSLPQDKILILAGAVKIDSKYKGYTELLPQFPTDESNNCHLVTFGRISKKLQSKIKVPATHLGTISSLKELKELYQAADIFIAPSTQEAFGKTLAEAGATGLPVVCYDTGGPKDIVADGVTGHRVQIHDTKEFVRKTLDLAAQHDHRQEMGRAAIDRTHKLFSSNTAAQQHLKVYDELLSQK